MGHAPYRLPSGRGSGNSVWHSGCLFFLLLLTITVLDVHRRQVSEVLSISLGLPLQTWFDETINDSVTRSNIIMRICFLEQILWLFVFRYLKGLYADYIYLSVAIKKTGCPLPARFNSA